MSSELLGAAQNVLKGNLGGAWDINKGYADAYTDLGIARRFGGAAAAYSLRDIGAMNGIVVRVRRDTGGGAGDDDEEDFSANQIASGALEDFVGSGNDGFVAKWYDQSGNGRHMIQATHGRQPYIVKSGVYQGGVGADLATSSDTMQNLQVTSDGSTIDFGTDDWANGGTKLGAIYVGKVFDGAAKANPSPLWGGGRGVGTYQNGAVALQIKLAGSQQWSLVNEIGSTFKTKLITFGNDTSDPKQNTELLFSGTTDNRTFTVKINGSSTSADIDADLNVSEDQALSLFGAYAGSGGTFYPRSTSGLCRECYLYSGDNISEIDAIRDEINKHYSIYT